MTSKPKSLLNYPEARFVITSLVFGDTKFSPVKTQQHTTGPCLIRAGAPTVEEQKDVTAFVTVLSTRVGSRCFLMRVSSLSRDAESSERKGDYFKVQRDFDEMPKILLIVKQ